MIRTPTSLRDSQRGSAESDESADTPSPGKEEKTPSRGRKAQASKGSEDVEMAGTMA